MIVDISPDGVELEAVAQHEPHIVFESLQVGVFVLFKLVFDGIQVHGISHNLGIVWDVFRNRVDRH